MTVTSPSREELLILTKTYPSPSARYRETSCVAALNRNGQMRRLFPIPFRLLEDSQQFRRWEWIQARISEPRDDHRPESRRLDIETMERTGELVDTRNGWAERRRLIEPHILDSQHALETRRQTTGETLGFCRPTRLLGLDIVRSQPNWTEKEMLLLQQQGLFDSGDTKARPLLRKIPYDFYYRYECDTADGVLSYRHKLVDWEVGALFWTCQNKYGQKWESYFRQKLEVEFADKDLILFLGTIHRFPDKWLVIGLVYPPKTAATDSVQLALDLPS